MGRFAFLLSCDGDLREPLKLPQRSQASFLVARGTLEFLWSCCSGIGPLLELRLEPQGSSPVVPRNSGFLPSFCRGVRAHHFFRHGTPLSSQVVKGLSGLW